VEKEALICNTNPHADHATLMKLL